MNAIEVNRLRLTLGVESGGVTGVMGVMGVTGVCHRGCAWSYHGYYFE